MEFPEAKRLRVTMSGQAVGCPEWDSMWNVKIEMLIVPKSDLHKKFEQLKLESEQPKQRHFFYRK